MNFNLTFLKKNNNPFIQLSHWFKNNIILCLVLSNSLTLMVSMITLYKVNSLTMHELIPTMAQQNFETPLLSEPTPEPETVITPEPERIRNDMQKIKEIINNLSRTALIAHTAFTPDVQYAQRQMIQQRLEAGSSLLSQIHPALSMEALQRILTVLQGRFTQSNYPFPFKHPMVMKQLPIIAHALNIPAPHYPYALRMIIDAAIPESLKHELCLSLRQKNDGAYQEALEKHHDIRSNLSY